jgi:hypothetical protein
MILMGERQKGRDSCSESRQYTAAAGIDIS